RCRRRAHRAAGDRRSASLLEERARRSRRPAVDRADAAGGAGSLCRRGLRAERRPARDADPRGSVIARYSRPAMGRVWSDQRRLAAWLEVELAALEGWAELGAVPASAVVQIRAAARPARL